MGNKKSRYTWRNLRKGRVLALLAAIGITGGGVKALASAVNTGNEKAVNIEEISNDKSMLKTLGISKETAERINSINEKLEHGDIDREEMEGLVKKIHAVQLDVIKEKIAKALNVDKESVTLDYSADTNADETKCVIVDGTRYVETGPISGYSIDNEIGDFIVDVVNCNRLIEKVEGKIYIKGTAIEKCKKFMKNVNDLALNNKIVVDEMGNISTEKIKNEKSISTEEAQLVGNTVQTKAVEGKEFKASISEKTYNGINKNSDAEQQKNEINKVNDDYGER